MRRFRSMRRLRGTPAGASGSRHLLLLCSPSFLSRAPLANHRLFLVLFVLSLPLDNPCLACPPSFPPLCQRLVQIEEEHVTFYFLSASLYVCMARRALGCCVWEHYGVALQEGRDGEEASGLTERARKRSGRGGGGGEQDGAASGADAKGICCAGILLLLSRVLQSWNQTGVKNYGAPDIGALRSLPARACAEELVRADRQRACVLCARIR
jgi:hypothetical protein